MLDKKARCLACHDLPNSEKARHDFAAIAAGVRPKLQSLAAIAPSPAAKQILDRVDQSTTEWTTAFGEFLAKASAHQFDAGHSIITDRMEPISERISQETKEVEAVETRELARSQAETAAGVKHWERMFFGILFALLVPAVIIVWRIIRSLTARIKLLTAAAQLLAAGDAVGASGLLSDECDLS